MAKKQNLTFTVGADTRKFKRDMAGVKKSITGVGKGLAGGLGLGSLMGIGGLTYGLSSIVNKLDDLDKSSKRLGVSTRDLQVFSQAADEAGASMEDVESAIGKMAYQLESAKKGTYSTARAFEVLKQKSGMDTGVDTLSKMSVDQQFKTVINALGKVKDSGTRMAIARELVGRSGVRTLPMAGTFNDVEQHMEKTGGIVSEHKIDQAARLKDTTSRWGTGFLAAMMNGLDSLEMVGHMGTAAASKGLNKMGVISDDHHARVIANTLADVKEILGERLPSETATGSE